MSPQISSGYNEEFGEWRDHCQVRSCRKYRIVSMPLGQFSSSKETQGLGNYHLLHLFYCRPPSLSGNRKCWGKNGVSGQTNFSLHHGPAT